METELTVRGTRAWMAALALCLGCSSTGAQASGSRDASLGEGGVLGACVALAERSAGCEAGSKVDQNGCDAFRVCLDQKLDPPVIAQLFACFDTKVCTSEKFGACYTELAPQFTSSAAYTAYRNACTTKLTQCPEGDGGAAFSDALCGGPEGPELVPFYRASELASLTDCFSGACSDVSACIARVGNGCLKP